MPLRRLAILLTALLLAIIKTAATDATLYSSDRLTSNIINALAQDRQGYIWIGTRQGLNRFDGYRFIPYACKKGDTRSLPHNNVVSLLCASDGTLWVGTNDGLALYSPRTDDFTRINLNQKKGESPYVNAMAETKDGDILVATSGFGLYEIRQGSHKATRTRRFDTGKADTHSPTILVDSSGRLWRTRLDNTILCYSSASSPKSRLLLSYRPDGLTPVKLTEGPRGQVTAVCDKGTITFKDTRGEPEVHFNAALTVSTAASTGGNTLILGTSGKGLYHLDKPGAKPLQADITLTDIDVSTAAITAVLVDAQHNLWVGCDSRGLIFKPGGRQPFRNWNLSSLGVKTGSFVVSATATPSGHTWCAVRYGDIYRLDHEGHADRHVSAPAGLTALHADAQGHLWAGASNRLYRLDAQTGRCTQVAQLDGSFIQSITDDRHGKLYLSDFSNGLTIYDTASGRLSNLNMYRHDKPGGYLCNNWLFDILCDSRGLVWAATSSGVACYDPARERFDTYGWNNILEGMSCKSLAEDSAGDILIGTDRGMFRFRRKANKTAPYPDGESLDGISVNAIQTEPGGDWWCATSAGIWHYDRRARRLTPHVSDPGLGEREYTDVGVRLSDGRIAFGNSGGLVVFSPSEVKTSHTRPHDVRMTGISVGGQRANATTMSGGRRIMDAAADRATSFSLSYLDATFTLEFSTLDYATARNTILEYRLGSGDWTHTPSGVNTLTFSHLQPGSYTLKVRSVEGGETSATSTYNFTIRSPWYASTQAYCAYAALLATLCLTLIKGYTRRRKRRFEEEKMQFLINATHDIRTPLTLIVNPLRQLMKDCGNDAQTAERLDTIDRNTRRILTLVNQILDVRKIDRGMLRLRCQPTSLVPFIKNAAKVFELHARERNIRFDLDTDGETTAWIDRTQFDKVVQNLLSNAFKYTPDGGSVALRLTHTNSAFTLSVADSGPGLCGSDIPKLFTRFYQSSPAHTSQQQGTGIGLNLCKKVVELHHGSITAANRGDGQSGSIFTVTLPLGYGHLKADEIAAGAGEADTEGVKARKADGAHILIADDDTEIAAYMASELAARYRCGVCHNGKEALRELLAEGSRYDLVVSDIMMPEMDGFTLLRTIKSNPALRHTPVILLTSEAAVGNRLEGLRHGADAFIAKPFLVDELLATIQNLLSKTVQARSTANGSEEMTKENVGQRNLTDNDQRLMERILQSIDARLSNSEYSVEQLAADAGLSRSQLHRKMKELTGLSPSEFMRNLRLEQAARLLRERKVNVSEVAYTVGFTTLGNFSKAFKQHFGMPPTEYASQGE